MTATCTSTGIAGFPKPYTRTQFAVFGPTCGNRMSSSYVAGTVPPCRSKRIRDTSRIFAAFWR